MAPSVSRMEPGSNGPLATDYILDMIAELAILARRAGETGLAIHLEAILEARRAERESDPG